MQVPMPATFEVNGKAGHQISVVGQDAGLTSHDLHHLPEPHRVGEAFQSIQNGLEGASRALLLQVTTSMFSMQTHRSS